MPAHFQITLASPTASAEVISILRRALDQPVGALKEKILAGKPIIDEKPRHNAYEDFIRRASDLLRELDRRAIGYKIRIDGRPETAEYLRNIFARWFRIGRELQEYDDRIAKADEGG
jgi:hypothetical protein